MNIEIKKVKIIVTVPTENTKDIRNAVCNAGAGTLSGSNYTYCTTHVITELRKAHPYEEPAIDIVPLIDEDSLV